MKTQLTQGKKKYDSGRALVFDRQSLGLCGFLCRLWAHESGRRSPCYVFFVVFVNVLFCGAHIDLAAGLGCALFLFFVRSDFGLMDLAAGLHLLCSVSCAMATSSASRLFFLRLLCKFFPQCGDFRSNSPPTNLLSNMTL
jgi:hypothetical protein